MSGHCIELQLDKNGCEARLVCLEEAHAECRLSCPSKCETVSVCGRWARQCDLDQHPDALHCALCGATFNLLPADECHIVEWVWRLDDSYGGNTRTFSIPVDVDWEVDGARWSLPTTGDTDDAYAVEFVAGREAEREKVAERIVTMLLSDDAVEAFGAAWTNADTQGDKVPGARRRAGLEAVAALVVAKGEA